MSDIRLVKLKSGEEIIGDVTVISGDVIISNPCQLMPTDQGIGFTPWPPFAKHDNVTVKMDYLYSRSCRCSQRCMESEIWLWNYTS